ncbi:MAG TPA: T9SS type A sorting domain-containing protein, partial [Saprospiraceae bacterium]|nr:T9SS type A sorting domain-containing protein [Saprospiraceae bacterium]
QDQKNLVTIFDNVGKMLHQEQITFTNGSANMLIPLGLNTSLYWLHIKANNQAKTIPIIIQK